MRNFTVGLYVFSTFKRDFFQAYMFVDLPQTIEMCNLHRWEELDDHP